MTVTALILCDDITLTIGLAIMKFCIPKYSNQLIEFDQIAVSITEMRTIWLGTIYCLHCEV